MFLQLSGVGKVVVDADGARAAEVEERVVCVITGESRR
jgi:hypothetical protein